MSCKWAGRIFWGGSLRWRCRREGRIEHETRHDRWKEQGYDIMVSYFLSFEGMLWLEMFSEKKLTMLVESPLLPWWFGAGGQYLEANGWSKSLVRVDGGSFRYGWTSKKNEAWNEWSWKQPKSWLPYVISSLLEKRASTLRVAWSLTSVCIVKSNGQNAKNMVSNLFCHDASAKPLASKRLAHCWTKLFPEHWQCP